MNTIITDKMTFGGKCIAKINGKSVFVPFSIPGEKIEVEIESSKKDYDVAKIVNIIEKSPYRVEPVCKYYGICGGCNMMHIESSYQQELRKNVLKDCFARNGIKTPNIQVLSSAPLGYRSRFQLNNGGLSKRAENEIVPVDFCPIAEKPINKWLSENPFEKRPLGRCHLFGSEKMIFTDSENSFEKNAVIASENCSAKNAKNKENYSKNAKKLKTAKKVYAGTVLNPCDTVTVSLLGKKISFDVKGFFQSNLQVLESAIKEVCKGLVGENVLDMYAGCGTFSVFLADFFKKVTLVEHNRDALVFAAQNLASKNCELIGLSGEKWISSLSKNDEKRFDAVVIDPPRSGMEVEVRKWLCNSNIPQIRSVSCDPATHARDVSELLKAGYRLERLFLLDFYPNTSHIESLAVLEKGL